MGKERAWTYVLTPTILVRMPLLPCPYVRDPITLPPSFISLPLLRVVKQAVKQAPCAVVVGGTYMDGFVGSKVYSKAKHRLVGSLHGGGGAQTSVACVERVRMLDTAALQRDDLRVSYSV